MSPAPLVRFEHVDVALEGVPILHDIHWHLNRGEHWGIVGANGSGKSTLLGLIGGTLWPAPGSGQRSYDFGAGTETDAVHARSEIVLVSHELQDRYARLNWNFTALDVVLQRLCVRQLVLAGVTVAAQMESAHAVAQAVAAQMQV